MSHSIRFLGVAIIAWAAVRAVSLGIVPGIQALAFDVRDSQPALPPIQPTVLPPIDPVAPSEQYATAGPSFPGQGYPPYGAYQAYAPYPVYVPIPGAAPRNTPPQIIYVNPPASQPGEIHVYGASLPNADAPQLAAALPIPARQSTPSFAEPPGPKRLLPERLSLSSWAMMRKISGSDSLANGGQLGGSQAGVRLLWRFDPRFSASLRASAPINSQRGVEAAAGVRYQPFGQWPVAVTLERRQAFRDYGQSAFAFFAEGGLYGRPMPWNATMDAYFQGGVVDFNNPDWFVDGQAAVSRPVWRNLSAGLGVWGGAQPGLSRLDIGPRASLRIGTRMRVHLDYRYKVVGNAAPGSGTVVTLAGDF